MKKVLIPFLAATTLFVPVVLSGCGSNVENTQSKEMHEDHDHDHHGHEH